MNKYCLISNFHDLVLRHCSSNSSCVQILFLGGLALAVGILVDDATGTHSYYPRGKMARIAFHGRYTYLLCHYLRRVKMVAETL